MQVHELKRKNPNKKKKLVGRGGTRGKTSGRGTKGQNSRAGRKKRPELRTIIKKLPKLRGYKFNSTVDKNLVVNVGDLSVFAKGEEVNPTNLLAKKLISFRKGVTPVVKILGTGELATAVTVSGCKVSDSAKEKIVAAGGSVL
jgi:large subunit ribosomal protein L15